MALSQPTKSSCYRTIWALNNREDLNERSSSQAPKMSSRLARVAEQALVIEWSNAQASWNQMPTSECQTTSMPKHWLFECRMSNLRMTKGRIWIRFYILNPHLYLLYSISIFIFIIYSIFISISISRYSYPTQIFYYHLQLYFFKFKLFKWSYRYLSNSTHSKIFISDYLII